MAMDWIERLFNISPDGGDGSLELLIAGGAAATVALMAFRRRLGSLWRRLRRQERHLAG